MTNHGGRRFQGSFNEHIAALRRLGMKGIEVRKAVQLKQVSSLIIPGGESTTMANRVHYHNLFRALREFVKMGKPVWGTCAGLIFLANKADRMKEEASIVLCTGTSSGVELSVLEGSITCCEIRNVDCCYPLDEILMRELAPREGGPESGVFIRAPAVLEAGSEVEVLAKYIVSPEKSDRGIC